MDDALATSIIETVAREQLVEYRDELTVTQMRVIADQVAREAWRRLKRELQNSTKST